MGLTQRSALGLYLLSPSVRTGWKVRAMGICNVILSPGCIWKWHKSMFHKGRRSMASFQLIRNVLLSPAPADAKDNGNSVTDGRLRNVSRWVLVKHGQCLSLHSLNISGNFFRYLH